MAYIDRFAALSAGVFLWAGVASAIVPNPNVSMGKNLYVDGAVNTNWQPGVYTDGSLDFNQISSTADFALNVGEGPKKLFITWETRGDEAWAGETYIHAASCQHTPAANAALQNFKVMTSANSTNGADGDWETVAQVGESGAMSRGLEIDFAGKSWFRIVAESAVANLEEVGAYDMSKGGNDTWFFMGTSISQMGIKQFTVDSSFAQLVHARFPDYYPAMLRGGIGCITSQGVADGLKYYAQWAGNVKYWAIEMGTNDAWGGSDANVATFTKNMQTIIDTAKAHGITPIIARMIATNPDVAKWQVNQAYLDAIDKLTKDNNLPAGPDFYGYFSEHPEELSTQDGVHPADPAGGQSMHRLWAEAVAPLYASSDPNEVDTSAVKPADSSAADISAGDSSESVRPFAGLRLSVPQVHVLGRAVAVSGVSAPSRVTVLDPMGHVLFDGRLDASNSALQLPGMAAGRYFVAVRNGSSLYKTSVTVK